MSLLRSADEEVKFEDMGCEPIFNARHHMYDPETHVQVRVISSRSLAVDLTTGLPRKKKRQNPESEKKQGGFFEKVYRNIKSRFGRRASTGTGCIIHVHGGGFVAMSSGSHQNYTRMWANDVGVPIISVDYRLAPQYQFPCALNDVWQVYYWVVMYGEACLGLNTDKVILVGDSAGGNLVAAVTAMAIERNFRVPDGLVMCYPALSLDKYRFSPSFLLGIDDPILPYPFLKMCIESYVGDNQESSFCCPSKCQYISPVLVKDEVLSRFPTTRIMVAQNDPLRDESFRFTLRMAKLGLDVFLKEYMYMPHGYLNYNAPLLGMKEESNEAINQCARWLNDFLYERAEDLE